jgi:Ca2+-binding RTX toxin-like protein
MPYCNAGNNLILGGTGRDVIEGGSGSDLMIANRMALLARETSNGRLSVEVTYIDRVMAVWNSTAAYADRVRMLEEGLGRTRSLRISSTTVLRDSVEDQLFGGTSIDWFVTDTILDSPQDRSTRERLSQF